MSQQSTKNVEMTVEGDKLVITIDLTKSYGLSSAGRSEIVANCHWEPVPGSPEFSLVLTLVKKIARKRRPRYYDDDEEE